jgi:hypothetical protein
MPLTKSQSESAINYPLAFYRINQHTQINMEGDDGVSVGGDGIQEEKGQ